MGLITGIQLGVAGLLIAFVGYLYWDNGRLETANDNLRLEITSVKEAKRFADEARNVAIAEADRQAKRASTVKTRTITIRKRPDGNETAAPILLDTISGLRDDASGVPARTD
mgnify:CR=1 FL=1